MPRFRFGQIVYAFVRDGRGSTKEHPVLIISEDFDERVEDTLLVIVISSTPNRGPIPDYHIEVHNGSGTDSASTHGVPTSIRRC